MTQTKDQPMATVPTVFTVDPVELPMNTLRTEGMKFDFVQSDVFGSKFNTSEGACSASCLTVVLAESSSCDESEKNKPLPCAMSCFPEAVKALVQEAVNRSEFSAERGGRLYVPVATPAGPRSLLLFGIGSLGGFTPFHAAQAGRALGRACRGFDVTSVAVVLPNFSLDSPGCGKKGSSANADPIFNQFAATCQGKARPCPLGYGQELATVSKPEESEKTSLASMFVEVMANLRRDDRFMQKKTGEAKIKQIVCVQSKSAKCTLSEKDMRDAANCAEATFMAAQLAGAPANFCNPTTYANYVCAMAKSQNLAVTRLRADELSRMGYGAALAVGRGSEFLPELVHIVYRPAGVPASKKLKTISFVGKAVCMDTGGYNIKSAAGFIHGMKGDMAGSAAVVGAASAVAELAPKNIEVHFTFLAVENMIDSKAYRSGDIVTSASGKTIECINTDAEGRLTLADALHYAQAEPRDPDAIITFATLTGVAKDALGSKAAALFANNLGLRGLMQSAADDAGEIMWPMPIITEYIEDFRSPYADIKNTNNDRTAGSINAMNFLMEFVPEKPYAHVDMAGPMFDKDASGTGFAAKTIIEVCKKFDRAAA